MDGCHDAYSHRHPRPHARGRPLGPHRAALEALARVARRRLADRASGSRSPPRCSRYVGRRGLRDALTPGIAAAGAIGFGVVILLQNAGIERTSVSHAALLVGAVPVMVALLAAGLGHGTARPLAWAGYARGAGRPRARGGRRRLRRDAGGRPAGARLGGAVGDVHRRAAAAARRARPGRGDRGPVRRRRAGRAPARGRVRGLAGRARGAGCRSSRWARWRSPARCCRSGCSPTARPRVKPELAGAFLNLEPLVGAATGWLAFGETATSVQLAGAVAVLAGIALSTCDHPAMLAVFDGHNDTLTRDDADRFATGREGGHIDLPRAREGGLAGGIFAAFTATPGYDDLRRRMTAATTRPSSRRRSRRSWPPPPSPARSAA